ncbi:N-acetyl-gamma-glutamyl-phosphate reductase [uncultured Clostridium sp.]|uniref:N-acetyl-gamma-glutamyl-phosphate reductase n=1 Tax=uncultured Clostridium sp. TaxID=59620 RepID=UPI0025E59B09|nr:N-acetyl-gamma-glutamyl-phosphate reductase [uncultured Clostridium sp.]
MMETENIKKVAILGGNGFAGGEVYRILAKHPNFQVEFMSSESMAGKPIDKYSLAYRHEKNKKPLKFKKISELTEHYDVIFSCLPTGVLPKCIEDIYDKADVIFNLSGDYRLEDSKELEKYYPETLNQKFKVDSEYYIPEFAEMKKAKVINLPGCMAVASIYSIYPLLSNDLIEGAIITEAKTGSSGAGKSTKEVHAERSNNFRPYKIFGHRHKPEIEFCFKKYLGKEIDYQFSAFSLDLPRGIMSVSYTKLKDGVKEVDVKKAFYSAYSNKPFIQYFNSKGGKFPYPMIKTVVGTNYAEVGVYVEGNNCVTVVSIDNLIKGAAGQAIQAANIYFGYDETLGLKLESEGMWP